MCRKCSLLATHRRLVAETNRLSQGSEFKDSSHAHDGESESSSKPSVSKKRRARETRKLVARVEKALEEGRVEEDIKGVKVERVFSKVSTKQAMIARVSDFPYHAFVRIILMFSILSHNS